MLPRRLYLCIFYLFSAINAEEPQCSNLKRDEIEHHLSSKTPYRVVANYEDAPLHYPGCKPTRIWATIRHGARNPSKEVIEEAMNNLLPLKSKILSNRRTSLCPEELARLRDYSLNLKVEEEKYLVAEGEDELIELAERMQNRFPDLLKDTYNPHDYFFKYTATQRALESAKSFATGLFGRDRVGEIIYPEALQRDPVLRRSKFGLEMNDESDTISLISSP